MQKYNCALETLILWLSSGHKNAVGSCFVIGKNVNISESEIQDILLINYPNTRFENKTTYEFLKLALIRISRESNNVKISPLSHGLNTQQGKIYYTYN